MAAGGKLRRGATAHPHRVAVEEIPSVPATDVGTTRPSITRSGPRPHGSRTARLRSCGTYRSVSAGTRTSATPTGSSTWVRLRGSAENTASGDGKRSVSCLTSTGANRTHPSAPTCTRWTPAAVVTSTCRGVLAAGEAGETSWTASTTRRFGQPRVSVGRRSPWLATQVVVVSPSRTAPACAAGSETRAELATTPSDDVPTT